MAGENILIVEDHGILARDLQRTLRNMGYTVRNPVATGEAALAAAATELPNMVLMDIGLPGEVDGIAAAKEIHAAWGTPIIFLTTYAADSVLQRAKAAAPYGYLIKPVSERQLAVALEMAFYRHSLDRQSKKGLPKQTTGAVEHWNSEELSLLSPRDREVFDLLVMGMSLKRIATTIKVSVQAVWKHEQNIFQKLDVESMVELLSRGYGTRSAAQGIE